MILFHLGDRFDRFAKPIDRCSTDGFMIVHPSTGFSALECGAVTPLSFFFFGCSLFFCRDSKKERRRRYSAAVQRNKAAIERSTPNKGVAIVRRDENPITTNFQKALITMCDKGIVIEAVRRMPEDCTLEEISEQIEISAAIRLGELAADTGKVVPHEEVKNRLAARTFVIIGYLNSYHLHTLLLLFHSELCYYTSLCGNSASPN